MPVPSELADRRIALLLFLTLHFLYLLTSSGRVHTMDEVTVDYQVESLATKGSTAIPQAAAEGYFYGKRDQFGQPQGAYGPGNAALIVPWYWVGRLAGAVLPGIPKIAGTMFRDAFLVASSAAFSAAAAAFLYLLLRKKRVTESAAFFAATLLALATPMFSYSSWFFSEPLAAALLLGGLSLVFGVEESEEIPVRDAAFGGLLLGVLVCVRMTHAIALPVVAIGMLLRRGGAKRNLRAALALCIVSGVFCALYLLRNYYLFGNPLDVGYPQFAEGGKNVMGFGTPLLKGLWMLLFSPGKSLFVFAPPLLLAIPGLFALARKDRGLALTTVGISLAYLFFYAKYSYLEGGYSYGPRYLVPVIALLCLGLGPMLEKSRQWVKPLAVATFVAGIFVNVTGMATNFMEDMTHGKYYDANFVYRTDYSPIGSMLARFWHYATMQEPAALGHGFDRWFVFLTKTGVARGLIVSALLIELFGVIFFAWRLARVWKVTAHESN